MWPPENGIGARDVKCNKQPGCVAAVTRIGKNAPVGWSSNTHVQRKRVLVESRKTRRGTARTESDAVFAKTGRPEEKWTQRYAQSVASIMAAKTR